MKLFVCIVSLLIFKFSSAAEDVTDASTISEPDTTLMTTMMPEDTTIMDAVEDASPPNITLTSRIKADEDVVEKVNIFGYNLLKTLIKRSQNENVVISPTGVAGLLAMTLLGSAGRTYDEIAQLIGFSQDILTNRGYHEELGSKLQSLNANDTKTLYANAVFVDAQWKLREVYREYLHRVYHGEALEMDFLRSAAVKETINEWVKKHTGNRIAEFLQQPLPLSTKAVLLTALYFSGQWAYPFLPEYTAKLPFNTPTNEVLVDLMANFGRFDYIFSYEDELQMIALPYNDSVTTMYVIKPKFPKRQNISQLIENLDYPKIDRLIEKMSKRKCVLRFPKMELTSKTDLKESLIDLGAETMFLSGQANFALMLENKRLNKNRSEEELVARIANGEAETKTLREMVDGFANPGVHVDSVMHEVKMIIDEYGTEAVAATATVMARSAELFYTDSPFYLFIRNERTKLVTFSAVVFDPSQ